ncbi:MAG TPA: Holliday junction resolvase RuvX [bacterium]|nr:Holliday junction resolvase RuvX [bacterium]
MTRVLGIDLGTKRIGLALSDPSGIIASPLATLAHRSMREDVERVATLCASHGVTSVVVGWPRNMDGTPGPAARQAETFAGRLRAQTGLPVELWDERLSTVAADRAMIRGGARREDRRLTRDRVAAAMMLQSCLDARASRSPRERS